MKFAVVFCSVAVVLGICWATCPPEEQLVPHCFCRDSSYGGALYCSDIVNPLDLRGPIEACRGHLMFSLAIYNSSLLYLPHDLFTGTNFKKIMLTRTELMSLSNGKLAFEGLENTMTELRAYDTNYVTEWRFSQLQNLKRMDLIDIHSIYMESLSEDLPAFPVLEALGVTHGAISHISDKAFAECPKLKFLNLQANEISELKRSMLPKPAEQLLVIRLSDNELAVLPEDFFTEMPSLMQVDLANNGFTYLDEKIFSPPLKTLNTLILTNNPLRCDCRMAWLPIRRSFPLYFQAECYKPDSLKGKRLRDLSSRDLWC